MSNIVLPIDVPYCKDYTLRSFYGHKISKSCQKRVGLQVKRIKIHDI